MATSRPLGKDYASWCFVEVTAGDPLANVLAGFGVRAFGPVELENLASAEGAQRITSHLRQLRAGGLHILLHCELWRSSLSRARGRNFRTEVRTPTSPWGVDPLSPDTMADNVIIEQVLAIALVVVAELQGAVCISAPCDSYAWSLLDFSEAPALVDYLDVLWLPCCYGDAHRTAMRLRCWGGFRPRPLEQMSCHHLCLGLAVALKRAPQRPPPHPKELASLFLHPGASLSRTHLTP